MKTVRLLPIVIAATVALLLLTATGLVTQGGYVLLGTGEAVAAGGGGGKAAEVAAGDSSLTLLNEPTLTDVSPTLKDSDPTLGKPSTKGGHGGAAKDAAHAEADGGAAHGDEAAADETHGEPAAEAGNGGEAGAVALDDPAAEGVPMGRDAAGKLVPLSEVSGKTDSETAILQRLGARRGELDAREEELELRSDLIEAAEKRIEERTRALEALEKRIAAMVDQQEVDEKAQLEAVVSMYETMKPKDAAAIFDRLDIAVLLRVVRKMNPRKVAPILAKMDTLRARELTSALAVEYVAPSIELAGEDLSALPQIVGQ